MNVHELAGTARQLVAGGKGLLAMDESISTRNARFAEAGIMPGIKVDMGTTDLAGHPVEKVTEGLDGLRARQQGYWRVGARFSFQERSTSP